MTRRRPAARGLLVWVLLALGACHNRDLDKPDAAPATTSTADPSPSSSAQPRADAAPSPRCVASGTAGAASAPFGQGAELGEAAPYRGGYVFGALREEEGVRWAAAILVGDERSTSQNLGLSSGDSPAPKPVVRGDDVIMVGYVRAAKARGPRADGHRPRRALLATILASPPAFLFELPPESDDSSAYDAVASATPGAPSGLVIAWDDEVGQPVPHGVIQVAATSPDLATLRAIKTVKPLPPPLGQAEADAVEPRLVLRDGGFWLTYIARRSEIPKAALPLPAGEVETPSEEATYRWVEAVALGADGTPEGPPHALTSTIGHVASYAPYAHEGVLEVVAVDEGITSTVGGASLVRVVWRAGGSPEAALVLRGSVDDEAEPLVVSSGPGQAWVEFSATDGAAELAPLPAESQPAVDRMLRPVAEPLLVGARIVGASAGSIALASAAEDRGRDRSSDRAGAWTLTRAACKP
jgi:hypothetical protein